MNKSAHEYKKTMPNFDTLMESISQHLYSTAAQNPATFIH